MLDEGGKPRRQDFRQPLFAGVVERAGQEQRAGVVVDAIAVGAIRHAVNGMLKQSGVVAHRQEMAELHFRRRAAVAQQRIGVRARNGLEPMPAPGILKYRHVALGGSFPCHGAAARIGALAHRLPKHVVGQELCDFDAERGRVAKGHQNAAAVGEQFAGMPIWRGNHRLAEPETIGQRARRHLGFIQIWRHINVGHRDEIEQRLLIDELVEKHHVILDAGLARMRHQALTIGFALIAYQVRMRRPEYDVNRVGPGFQNRGHGVDHDLDAFVRRQQAECQDDSTVDEAKLVLGLVGLDECKLRDAVRDDFDLLVGDMIDRPQQLPALFSHHHDLGRCLDNSRDDIALGLCRLGQDRVQRGDDRDGQARQQGHDLTSGFAAENAEFMLQGNRLEAAAVEVLGRPHIIIGPIVVDLDTDRGRIIIDLAVIGHRHDHGFQIAPRGLNGALQIGGKGRDAAAAGQRVSDERDTIYDGQFGVSDCSRAARSGEVGTSGADEEACGTRPGPAALRSLSRSRFTVGPG